LTDYRSAAEKFVTEFLDYVEKYDILDEFDKRTQKMIRSAGMVKLINQAATVFPPRVKIGKIETDGIVDMDATILASNNVLDRRDIFSKKIQTNGGARGLLERILEGDVTAIPLARELLEADKGEKEFYVPTEK
jgi:hypothetical protein